VDGDPEGAVIAVRIIRVLIYIGFVALIVLGDRAWYLTGH
jgi:hypothetical protein